MVLARPPQPAKERMLWEQSTERLRRAPARMVSGVMDPSIGREGLQHPGSQDHRLFRRITAFAMQIQDRMAIALREMPPLRPRSSILRVPVLTQSNVMA
jgi:hypothetical protein